MANGSTTEGDHNEATQTAVLAVMATETMIKNDKKEWFHLDGLSGINLGHVYVFWGFLGRLCFNYL